MSTLKVRGIRHDLGTADAISVGSTGDVTFNNDVAVTGDLAVTGTIPASQLTGTLPALDGSNLTGITTGKVLQVNSVIKTDTQSLGSATWTDITGISISITPSSTSSKILVMPAIAMASHGQTAKVAYRIVRDSTALAIGDAAGSRTQATAYTYYDEPSSGSFSTTVSCVPYLDSPSTTSATTYKIQFRNLDNTGTVYINRSYQDVDGAHQGRSVSTLTVMEIGA